MLLAALRGGTPDDSATAAPARDSSPERASRLVEALTLDEKIALLHTQLGLPIDGKPAPIYGLMSAGAAAGVPRLGIPPLEETDAGLGVADPTGAPFDATAMPSALALGATFDPALAEAVGAAVGAEARDRGFGVVLGGGADLIREPRGGRDFEYVSEDPLLTGLVAGADIRGVQSRKVVCTLKHFALNDQENGRVMYSARLSETAARESDLLGFEIALEQGRPGAVMTSYNRVDGTWTSQNAHLLTDILKGDWRFPGWVMSDWGGVHSTVEAALAGLDQESGEEDDRAVYFGAPLKTAVANGSVPHLRIDDMVHRQLAARIAAGLFDDPPSVGKIRDHDAHMEVARRAATEAAVLLKNGGDLLPLDARNKRILVVGRMADKGVLSGGGSSQVVPLGAIHTFGEPKTKFSDKPLVYDPSSPLDALRRRLPDATIDYRDGEDIDAALAAARQAEVVVFFAEQWSMESLDHTSLTLPNGQDALIAALAAANPRIAVVLQTGGPVTMPWLADVKGVLEAWYSGSRGGDAIADLLTGRAVPSGRLPVTFPVVETQLPRVDLPEHDATADNPADPPKGPWLQIDYDIEGADVGYRWFLRKHETPQFPFGFGLSYTRFAHERLVATVRAGTLSLSFDVRDVGTREGDDVPQVYIEGTGLTRRLLGWSRVTLRPGETRHVAFDADPRLFAHYDEAAHGWHVMGGRYTVSLRPNALDAGESVAVDLPDARWPALHGPCGGVPCKPGLTAAR